MGGAVKAVKLATSGDTFNLINAKRLVLREMTRTFSSIAMLLPKANYWKDNEMIIQRPVTSYGVKDFRRLFADIGYIAGIEMVNWQRKEEFSISSHPGVKFHCFYSNGVDTPARLAYNSTDKSWFDVEPEIEFGEGDGSVNIRSLRECDNYRGVSTSVTTHVYDGVDHMKILTNNVALADSYKACG